MHGNNKTTRVLAWGSMAVVGIVLTCYFRSAAITDGATLGDKIFFASSLLLTVLGLTCAVAASLPRRQKPDARSLATAAMFAALCYIGFTFFKIDIPVGTGKTAFHFGNVFCVLGALFLGGFWGGLAGAVGMSIADLTTAYVTSAPKTFLMKLCIGLITGFVAHKVFHISRDDAAKKNIPLHVVISCSAGMLFNVIMDPLIGYFYKTYLLGIPQEMAKTLSKMASVTTLVNAIIAVISATLLYLALRPALKRARFIGEI